MLSRGRDISGRICASNGATSDITSVRCFAEPGAFGNWDSVAFSPASVGGPAYVLSAAGGLRSAAVDNRPDGFTLSVLDGTGAPTFGGDLQWLGYAGPPAILEDGTTDSGTDGDRAGGLNRIVVAATWSRELGMAMPLSVCFQVSTDPGGELIVSTACGGGDPLTLTLGSETEALEVGVVYYVSERVPAGWEVADDNPVELRIPSATAVAIVFFHNIKTDVLFGVEQGQIIITTAFAAGTARPVPDSVVRPAFSVMSGARQLTVMLRNEASPPGV